MQIDGINSAWGQQQASKSQGSGGQDFAAKLAANGLSAGGGNQVKSGGQLLSDDMARALASYSPVSGAAVSVK